jgi:Secretion system C-terminal sorting domain
MKTIRYKVLAAILYLTIHNLGAQCYMDRHSTTWYEGWISCEAKASPNPVRGKSHWLMYSLGHKYVLGKSHWWNHNVPTSLDNGAKTVAIDYSLDGQVWTPLTTTSLEKASGLNHYEGQDGIDFGGVEARYVLVTVLETYGGSCAGISEVKIDVDIATNTNNNSVSYQECMQVEAYPIPFGQQLNVDITNLCGNSSILYVTDINGRKVIDEQNIKDQKSSLEFNTKSLSPGIYMINVISGTKSTQYKVVKIE